MKVIVDTSIWSQALRRSRPLKNNYIDELRTLIRASRVQMLGPIRQELLSGIKSSDQFDRLKYMLSFYPDLGIETEDYEKAAHYFNVCRQKGIQGSNIDFLICAIATHHKMLIYTSDTDFDYYQAHIPIELHKPPVSGS